MHKQISILAIAIIAASLISISAIPHEVDAQVSKGKKKSNQCNNVKVQVRVNGVEENQTVLGVLSLNDRTLSKQVTVEENETSTTLQFNFKKIQCPEIGTMFHGFVNGTHFEGELKSLKKPNKVSVSI